MSQSYKLSLWQRIKQLLNVSAEQAAIDDTKIANDLALGLDLGSDLNLTKQDKNNSHPSENESDSVENYPKDSKDNDHDDTHVSGSTLT